MPCGMAQHLIAVVSSVLMRTRRTFDLGVFRFDLTKIASRMR